MTTATETPAFAASADTLERWRLDPVAFVREAFNAEPDRWQAKVLARFPTEPRTALKACKGPGKSTVMAWIGWNFLLTRPHPNVVATSITGDNLRDGLWKEMAKWRYRCPLLDAAFDQRAERITSRQFPETWWMSARTWPRNADTQAQADTLAGVHSDYNLALIDEAGSIPPPVGVSAEAMLSTGIESHIVISGNPTETSGLLHKACVSNRASWYVVEITSDPLDPDRTPRVKIEWAEQQIRDWGGRDSPWVMVNVLGQFPPTAFTRLLGPEDCARARRRNPGEDLWKDMARVLGVDVAFHGEDRTVIYPRQGIVAHLPIVLRNKNPREVAAAVAKKWQEWEADACFVDNTGGYGAAVITYLQDMGHRPTPVGFSEKPMDARFANRRAEILWLLSDWVKDTGAITGSGDVEDLVGELCEMEYFTHNGRFQVMPKDDIKAVLGRSPDMADALALTFAAPVRPKARTELERWEAQTAQREGGGEYNFFSRT